jgi:hypothetical protein
MPEGGYGVGLFDSKGPTAFANAIKEIANVLTQVQGAFGTFGTSASQSIAGIAKSIEDLSGKLSGLQQSVQQAQGAMAGAAPGGMGKGGAAPTPSSTNGAAGGTLWTPGQPKDAGPFQGNPIMPPAAAPAPAKQQTQDMPPDTAKPKATQSQTGGRDVWGRAAESILPAMAGKAINFATGYGGSMISAAVQGATIGQMEAPAFGVSSQSLYRIPKGTLAQNAQDYAQSNYYAMMQMGAAPGTANWSTVQRGANQMMTLAPGMSRQGAMAAMNQMQQAPVLNRAVALGMNFRPGGKMETPEQQFSQIFNRLTMGNKIDAKTFEAMMQPGAPGQVNLQALGIDPNSDAYYGFMQYALTRLGQAKQGKGMPDVGTKSGAKQTPLGQTPYYAQLQATSAKSRMESEAEPALAEAAKRLNDAAAAMLHAADHFTGPLGHLANFATGIIPGPGGPGGIVGGALTMAGGLWAGKSLFRRIRGSKTMGGIFKKMGKGGGAVTEAEDAIEGGMSGKGKGGILGGLMDCFGCGGSGGLGNMFQGTGKLREMGGKAMDWIKGGERGGIRDILGKVLGSDVGKEGERLGMESKGFGGLFSRAWGATKGGMGKLGSLRGEGGLLSKAGGLLKGKAGGLAARAGLMGGEAAGLEGAGAALDATGIGAPIGLALNAAGIALMFHKQIGQAVKGIAHGVGGLFKEHGGLIGGALGLAGGGLLGGAAGHLLGGLFHHKKKQTDNTSDDSDTAALKNPPKGSVLDVLLQKPPEHTVLAAAMHPGGGQAGMGGPVQQKKGGGILGSLMGAAMGVPGLGAGLGLLGSALGITNMPSASAQTMGGGAASPYGWGYKGLGGMGVTDMSSLFANNKKQSSTNNSGNGGQGASSPGGGTGSDSGGPNLNGSGNVQQAYNYLLGKGLSDFQAAGVVGNLAQESGVNPNSNQSGGGPGRGIAQWTVNERWQGVLALAKQRNKPPTDLGVQLDFLWSEFQGQGLSQVKAATDVSGATQAFEQSFERAGTPAMQNRINFAKNVLSSKGSHYARGSQLIDRTQLAMLHKGEAVVPAADNYGTTPYNRNGAMGGAVQVVLNFKAGSVVLQVPPTSSQQDMDNMAKQFVAAISKPQLLAAVRST